MNLGSAGPPGETSPLDPGDRSVSPKPGLARDSLRARHYLHAGQYFATAEPTVVTTILGSCVAVCLWEPRLKIGGINHFVLPDWVGQGRLSPRFGIVAVASLVEHLVSLGCQVKDLRAKVFGGASVFGHRAPHSNVLGSRNVEVALMLLEKEGIPRVGGDLGGSAGRKLLFHTDDGESWVKKL